MKGLGLLMEKRAMKMEKMFSALTAFSCLFLHQPFLAIPGLPRPLIAFQKERPFPGQSAKEGKC
jgi:hypothetical protein